MNLKQMAIPVLLALTVLLSACSNDNSNQMDFTGTIMTGAQLGEVKNYCSDGLYLVSEDGYLVNQTTMLLLKIPDAAEETKMFSDPGYVGKTVQVTGTYPAQEYFCEALMCACEDYILVDEVQVLK